MRALDWIGLELNRNRMDLNYFLKIKIKIKSIIYKNYSKLIQKNAVQFNFIYQIDILLYL